MVDSNSHNKPHFPVPEPHSPIEQKPSKSYYTNLFFKSLIIVFVLIVIPLFPSQAPAFINQKIITKFWELLHLLFIGIAVSYGLFSRKNTKMDIETHSRIDGSQDHNLSGILHVPSIFEDGFENLCGSDEKLKVQNWNSQYFEGESTSVLSNGRSGLEEAKNFRSSDCKNGSQNLYGCDDKNVKHVWNSQYFQGESMVVIANGNYGFDQWGNKPLPNMDYKPLGLPVRRLRSRNVDTDHASESFNRIGSSSSLGDYSKSDDKINKVKIRGVVPINLGEKFKEVDAPSSIQWRSRSGRMELREEVSNVKPPVHTRPLSVGQFEFESLKSPSFRCRKPSQTSSISSSPKRPSPSISPEMVQKGKIEDLGGEKGLKECSMPVSQPPLAPRHGESSFFSLSSLGFSTGTSSEMNVHKSFKDDIKRDFSKSRREDSLMEPLDSEDKPAPRVKGLSRGKSVRTMRSNEHFFEANKTGEVCSNHIDDKVGIKCDRFKATSMENTGRRARHENHSGNTRNQNVSSICHMPNSTFTNNQNGEKQDTAESEVVGTEEDSDNEFDNFQVSSDEEAGSEIIDDGAVETNEVDRKAGEFIAKFREQIRLQKTSSFTRSSEW